MAYGTKYLFEFTSVNGKGYSIALGQNGYSGAAIRRAIGTAPVLRKQQNGPICGTSLEFEAECRIDGEFAELYTCDAKEFSVDLYRGNTLIWSGFVTTELYSEPSIAPPYNVRVYCNDGLGELKFRKWKAPGVAKRLYVLFSDILAATGAERTVNALSKLRGQGDDATGFFNYLLNLDYLEGQTYYDVLTSLLTSFRMTITQHGGEWLLFRESDYSAIGSSVSVIRFSRSSLSTGTLVNALQTTGQMGVAALWPVGNLSSSIRAAAKAVVVRSPWKIINAIENNDFSEALAGWTSTGDNFSSVKNLIIGAHPGSRQIQSPGYGKITQTIYLQRLTTELKVVIRAQFGMIGTASSTSGSISGKIRVRLVYVTTSGTKYAIAGKEWTDTVSDAEYHVLKSTQYYENEEQGLVYGMRPTWEDLEDNFLSPGIDAPGTLQVVIDGGSARVQSVQLLCELGNGGHEDRIEILNGAINEAEQIEVIGGRIPDGTAFLGARFMAGVLMAGDAPERYDAVRVFSDGNFSAIDSLSIQSMAYALSVSMPRLVTSGTLNVPASLVSLPLVLSGTVVSWIATYEWDLYADDLKFEAVSLPAASLSVESETVSEIGESSGESSGGGSSSGGSGGGGSVAPPSSLNRLVDVGLEGLADGDILQYDSSAEQWVNKTLASALSNYATKTWVHNQGYLTGITGQQVINALGYTPVSISDVQNWVNQQGFLTPSALATVLADYVTLGTAQTITGVKTFTGPLTIGSASTSALQRRIYFGDSVHYIELDADGDFHFSHGVWSDDFVTAGGANADPTLETRLSSIEQRLSALEE